MANNIYIGSLNVSTAKIGSGDTSMYIGATKVYPLAIPDYLSFEALDNNFTFQCTSGVSYSTNGSSWTSLAASTSSPSFSSGDTIYIKATNTPVSAVGSGTFSTSGRFKAKGNPLSMIYGDSFTGVTAISDNFAFDSMFLGCTGLTDASSLSLPATTITQYCYARMFSGCTSLVTPPPELPAQTMQEGCYKNMFMDCTSLTSTPDIKATTGATSACQQMFQGCSSLTAVTEIRVTTLAQHNFLRAFQWCTSLTTAPTVLPATSAVNQCYYAMFSGCTSLTAAPEIKLTKLDSRCCMDMFAGCTSLTTAPVLSAQTLASESYRRMFSGCTSLNSITCLATDISASNCTNGWVTSVAASGTFTKDPNMTGWTTGVDGIPNGWTVQDMQKPFDEQYLTFEAIDSGTFKFSGNSVSYSLDNGTTWTSLASNTSSPTVSAGSKIMFKATLTPSSSSPYGIGIFSSTGKFNVMGNPMSLLYGDNFNGQTSLSGKDYAFYKLFNSCSKLTSAENLSLPATTLATRCYDNMFSSCRALTIAPVLSAATLANYCYNFMFADCTALPTAPVLTATTLAEGCYYGMFTRCNSLAAAPSLPATTLANSCYREMFNQCSGLITAPALPATTLANVCYYMMFKSCTSLTTAPTLSAATLTNSCYNSMFNGCTSLNSITCLATNISASQCTSNWVNGVAASGTFIKASGMTSWTTGVNGIPSNWTVQDYS